MTGLVAVTHRVTSYRQVDFQAVSTSLNLSRKSGGWKQPPVPIRSLYPAVLSFRFLFFHLAAIAARAISRRRSGLTFFIRAVTPFFPPIRPISTK